MSQTIPVRLGEELDVEVIQKYLAENVKGFPNETIEVRQFPAGRSNLTYVIRSGDWKGVLRRPPFGPLPPKAHDMHREFEVLSKLNPIFPLTPKPYVFCSDEVVIGAPFYVMELVEGITLDNDPNSTNNLSIHDKQTISHLMVETMVEMHNVDYKKVSLDTIGYPIGFLERQVKSWVGRYYRYKTEDISAVDNIIKWLEANIPKPGEPTLIHNDYKINNVLFSNDLKKVNAILDWEMATIGDPLFDLGATLSYWIQENDDELLKSSLSMPSAQNGYISRREFLEMYATKTGRDVSSFQFYLLLAYFKIAVAVQQIYYRYATGQTNDERFKNSHQSAKNLIIYAERLTRQKNF